MSSNSENPLDPSTGTAGAAQSGELIEYVPTAGPLETQPPANPILVVHSLLRGRYPLAITLAAIGLIIGTPVGYFVTKPQYKSVGLIYIKPWIDKLVYATQQNGSMPAFDSFLSAQVAEIQGQRVMVAAMRRPEWSRGLSSAEQAKFAESLEVVNAPRSPLIQVSFTDPNPNVACAGATAVINEYEEGYPLKEGENKQQQLTKLLAARAQLQTDLQATLDSIKNAADQDDPDLLQMKYDAGRASLMESQQMQNEAEIALAQSGVINSGPSTAPSTSPSTAQIEAWIEKDPLLQQRYAQKQDLDLKKRVEAHRLGEQNPSVIALKQEIDEITRDIANRKAQLAKEAANLVSGSSAAPGSSVAIVGLTIEQLKAKVESLRQRVQKLEADSKLLWPKINKIAELRGREAETRRGIADISSEYDRLRIENTNDVPRIDVISHPVVPMIPDKDRRKALAAAGGLGLAALGVGIVALLGFLDRRMHYIDSAKSRLKRVDRMLGVLPELPEDLTDPEQASSAAYCVHRIRAMIQIRQRATGHKIFAVTSPAPGDGKTSLTITLGMSLASCGCRTLLVDCDMDGGGLTLRFGHAVRRPLGQILLDAGAIGEAKLQNGIDLARENKIKLGKALIQLNYVSEATIRDALKEQRTSAPGLGDVLTGESAETAIRSTGYPLLSVLPLGCTPGAHSGRMAPITMRRMLDSLVGRFDVVLVDCGPILGSIEAAIVSAEVDGVILVVSRGGDRALAEDAVNMLVTAGAEVEGIVFNRAESSDVSTSGFSSSGSIRSMRSSPAKSRGRGFGHFDTANAMNSARDKSEQHPDSSDKDQGQNQ